MQDLIKADICVIGAGSGGLSVAAGAAQMGAKVVLIEKAEMGGDCLNTGCVPSKALIAAAHAAHNIRTSGRFGVNGHEPDVDFAGVHRHVHDIIARIEPNDSQERFEGFGVHVIRAAARFIDPRTVAAGNVRVKARRFVIATGSRAAAPEIPGLGDIAYLTNESIFDLRELPEHLAIIGGGPIGVELAQDFRRLGSNVTVIEQTEILPRDDRQAAAVIRRRLKAEELDLREHAKILRVERRGNSIAVILDADSGVDSVAASHLLVAAGRCPNLEELDLSAGGVRYAAGGIEVDGRLRTSNKRIFAIGDVAGGYQFTHMAAYHAGIVIRNVLFRIPAKVDYRAVPWVTYTDPELAHVGQSEEQVRANVRNGRVLTWDFEENDRVQAERETDGFIKVMVDRRGIVLGATIVGARAGELIAPWVLAVSQDLKISAIASMIAPYPTLGEISKRAAGSYYTPSLFSKRTRAVVGTLRWLG